MYAASFRRLASGVAFLATGGAVLSLTSSDKDLPVVESLKRTLGDPTASVPSRSVQVSALSGASLTNPLDILVIGGGATGSGVALDAATRGLRVGLVERDDFSSGTSSRSTKLIHGGKAIILHFLISYMWREIHANSMKLRHSP